MTEKELIAKIQELKQIKPRKEWVFSVKNHLLGDNILVNKIHKPSYKQAFLNLFNFTLQRKLAYAFAALIFVLMGGIGFMYIPKQNGNIAVSPVAILAVKDNVETLKTKSKELSLITKDKPEDISRVIQEVKIVAKNITESIKKDPGLAREVALEVNNNKTYLTVTGENELKETSTELYKTIAEQLIKDLESETLIEGQYKSLERIKELFHQEKFTDALEGALLLGVAHTEK